MLDSPLLVDVVDEGSLLSDLPVSTTIEDVSEASPSLGGTPWMLDMIVAKS